MGFYLNKKIYFKNMRILILLCVVALVLIEVNGRRGPGRPPMRPRPGSPGKRPGGPGKRPGGPGKRPGGPVKRPGGPVKRPGDPGKRPGKDQDKVPGNSEVAKCIKGCREKCKNDNCQTCLQTNCATEQGFFPKMQCKKKDCATDCKNNYCLPTCMKTCRKPKQQE